MFGRKKETKPKPSRGQRSGSLSQYGLFDYPGDDLDSQDISDGGDSDLEAELAAISGGGAPKTKRKKPAAAPLVNIDSLVAESLRDIPTDEEISDTEDDPDILNELSELAVESSPPPVPSRAAPPPPVASTQNEGNLVQLLQERIEMYTQAEQNAKSTGDTSRARRLNRGLKTLKDQLKYAKAGKKVIEDEIPPIVVVAKTPHPAAAAAAVDAGNNDVVLPNQPESVVPTELPVKNEEPKPPTNNITFSNEIMEKIKLLTDRRNQYKSAALSAKKNGDSASALEYVKMVKQFDLVIQAVKDGNEVDISDMPGPPGELPSPSQPQKEEEHVQKSEADIRPGPSLLEEPTDSLIIASTVEEALQQRLQVYQQQETAAKEAGNTSKARRMGRIVKQYQDAIKLNKAGKTIPFDELPTPPGYGPIPGAPVPVSDDPPPAAAPPTVPSPSQSSEPVPSSSNSREKPPSMANAGRSNSVRKMGNQIGTGLVSKQLVLLIQRQKQFKEAALESKKKGEINEAKEYLKYAKGLDPLIDAAKGGLPVDLSTIPLPPQAKQELEDSYDIVSAEDCNPIDADTDNVMSRLEEQLTSQLKMCLETRNHHKALGDIAGCNRFDHLALTVKQDLDVVKMARKRGESALKFHYETKQFSIVQCNTDLGDNDLELTIVRGISYTVDNPKEIDTYVKFEFPYPQEEPVRDKTALVKDTNSPDYNAVFPLTINRTARPCLRIFKRHGIKLEIFSKGCCGRPCSCHFPFFSGFFTRDTLIGTVIVKLQPLETQTTLHDSFDLMDGRKTVGGKLEVKIRVRHPMLTKQIEQTTKKWLVIDH